nr:hypothetical protein [Pseudomonas amygdali]
MKVSDVGEAESSMSRATRRPLWDQQLSAVVAKVFNVKALRYTHWCETKRIASSVRSLWGEPAQHIALYAYETLLAADPGSKRVHRWSARREVPEQLFGTHCRRSLRHSGVRG